ncbi:glycosyltransferase [Lysobacter sp. F60174L2]|uniref:glycosyltransferase n=1 Tax=Lysobacter sp. F60174L2 TaxID=3459295 RepID=UPI00403DDF39
MSTDTQMTSLRQEPKALKRRRGIYADALKTYLRVVRRLPDDRVLDRLILRTDSRRALDLLALHASGGRMRSSDIIEHVLEADSTLDSLAVLAGVPVDPVLVVRLARILALQDHQERDKPDALHAMKWIYGQNGCVPFRSDHARLFQNLAFESGDFDLAATLAAQIRVSRLDRLIMEADLANPQGPSPFAGGDEWAQKFARLFARDGIEAPSLLQVESSEPFDRLACVSDVEVTDGPLVSVIVTSWRPGPGLGTAVRSLLNQSWRNLEILLIDDASPESYVPLLQQVAALDPRIRLVRLDQNGGTYEARNVGLRLARGELVTGQDSDDWSHPRRIEKQAKAILRNKQCVSTTSHAFRCDPTLVFNAPGTQARRENASSLMFRRTEVLDRVGFYDSTRKGGDTEYMLRIREAFGDRSHRALDQNLAMIRQSRGSLSTAEFRPGWRHPSRSAYRRSYEFWHATCRSSAIRLEPDSERSGRFPLPDRFRVKARPELELDLVFADDLRGVRDPLHLRTVLDEINIALRAGLKVGVMHLRSLRDMSVERIDTFWAPVSRLLQEGKVREVLTTDAGAPGALVIRRPEVAMFLSTSRVALRPRRLLVAACEPFVGVAGEVWYDPTACDKNLREAFGCRPVWQAEAGLAETLRGILHPDALIGPAYPVAVDLGNWRTPRRDFSGRRPVIGCIARDAVENFPGQRETLLTAYPPSGKAPSRFLGGESELLGILGDRTVPASWRIFAEGTIEVDVFLAGCDFFVYFGRGSGRGARARLFAQAMASGCVVITSDKHAASFDGAVVSATPDQVFSIVASMSDSPGAFADQVLLGRKYLERFDRTSFAPALGFPNSLPERTPVAGREVDPGLTPDTPEVIRDYVRIAGRTNDSLRLDATILRTGSENARELLAHMASGGRHSFLDIIRHTEAARAPGRRPGALRALSELDPALAVRLARILVLQGLQRDDRLNGLTLCEAMVASHGSDAVPRNWSVIFIDAALRLGFHTTALALGKVLKLNKRDRQLVEIDLHHPMWSNQDAAWLHMFNSIFRTWGLNELRLLDSKSGLSLFDRIDFDVAREELIDSDVKVTVIITAWRPTVALLSSLRSVLAQTWRNLEVLVVDDCSPAEYGSLFEACTAMDPRVQVLRQTVNQGTYMARNRGLSVATGEFVTFQDADDYSHPKRIELQLRPLIEDAEVMACRSASVRVDRNLLLANPGSPPVQSNASSLMIRRVEVLERIGYFDGVRKSADTEYALRIAAAFNSAPVELDHKMPLSLVRLEPNSLSRAEFKPGWRHPARSAYREAYDLWHQRIRSGEASPFLEPEAKVRSFPAPQRFQIDRDNPSAEYDVVFIGDWRQFGGPQKSMIEEIRALHKDGLRLAICQMEAFRFMTKERKPLCAAVRLLVHDGIVDQITTSDTVSVRLAVLRYPPILQYLQADTIAWHLSSAIIVANQAPSEHDGSDVRYCVSDCIRNARTLFGLDPVWAPQGPLVRDALLPLIPHELLDPEDMPGILDVSEWHLDERPADARVPVIGRYSRDNPLKFPATADELIQAYPVCDDINVRIMGGARTCSTLLGDAGLPSNWEVIPYGQMDVRDFLAEIDYFVYFDNAQIVEAFGRSILEAIASGRIVILPEKFRPVFGEAALYCEPSEVPGLVRSLHLDPAARAAVGARVDTELRRRFSHEAYAKRIAGIFSELK